VERAEKREFVTELNEVFKASGSVVVAHYAGVTVAQMNDFRSKMRAAGGTVKVAKNRLAKIALQGTESEGMTNLFKGQTLIAYSTDPMIAPKVVMDFAKTNDKVVVLGGAMGATTLNAEAVKSLATLPSLDELRAKLLGLLNAPATRVATALSPHLQASWLGCSRLTPRRTKPLKAVFRCKYSNWFELNKRNYQNG